MELFKELEKLTDMIKSQRDEIQVQMHLAGMEAKEEWEKAESKLDEFLSKAAEIKDDTKETTDELLNSTKIIGDEITEAYKRIVTRLKS